MDVSFWGSSFVSKQPSPQAISFAAPLWKSVSNHALDLLDGLEEVVGLELCDDDRLKKSLPFGLLARLAIS